MDNDEKLMRLLVSEDKIKKEKLIPIYKIHSTNKEPLEKLAAQFKLIDRETLINAKAKIYGGEPYLINLSEIDLEIAKSIPQAMAKRYNLICPGKTPEGKIKIALHNPGDSFALEYVQMRTGLEVEPYLALLSEIEDAWSYIYAEKKKFQHPFFNQDTSKVKKVKVIPSKLTIPGLSKSETSSSIEEAPNLRIHKAADAIIEQNQEDKKISQAVDSIKRESEVLSILAKTASDINSQTDEQLIIYKLLETALKICKTSGASIIMLQDETLYFKEAVGPGSETLKKISFPLNEVSIAGWTAINKTPLIVNDVNKDERHYKKVDKTLDYETKNILCVPLLWGSDVLGVMEVVNKIDGSFDEKDQEYLEILASQASIALRNALLIDQFQNFYHEVVEILIDCLESLDPISREHSLKVARLTSAIAKNQDLSETEYELLCYSAFLHDIGKIKCGGKKDKKLHALMGAQMLSNIKFFIPLAPYVKYHHEKYDGTGVPEGLQGDEIPLGARILAVSEGYFEDLSTHWDLPPEEVTEKFLQKFGSCYDPALKESFIKGLQEM